MTDDLPLDLTLREDLVVERPDGTTEVVLAAGSGEFELADVATVAAHANPSDTSLDRARRQQQIWQAWISQTASIEERPELFDVDDGFVRLIGVLASGEVSYRVAPNRSLVDDDGQTQYLADRASLNELVSQIVLFPTALPGANRDSVMVIDASGGTFDQRSVLRKVVRAGGQVAILGNGTGVDEPRTTVQVHDPEAADVAAAIALLLGAEPPTTVELEEATVAITVIAGVDLATGE